jgi:hypothetical protein
VIREAVCALVRLVLQAVYPGKQRCIQANTGVSRQTAVHPGKQRCIQAGRRQVQVVVIPKPTLLQAMARPLRMDIR